MRPAIDNLGRQVYVNSHINLTEPQLETKQKILKPMQAW